MISSIIDANCILRFLLNDTPSQALQTKVWLEEAQQKKREIVVPMTVVMEVYFVLRSVYKFPVERVVGELSAIWSLPFLVVEERETVLSALVYCQSSTIGFVDALLLVQAKEGKKELLTFDEKLKKLNLQNRG